MQACDLELRRGHEVVEAGRLGDLQRREDAAHRAVCDGEMFVEPSARRSSAPGGCSAGPGELASLGDPAFDGGHGDQVHSVELVTDVAPGVAALDLGHPHAGNASHQHSFTCAAMRSSRRRHTGRSSIMDFKSRRPRSTSYSAL